MNSYFIVVDSNPEPSARMKYYSRAADVEYWERAVDKGRHRTNPTTASCTGTCPSASSHVLQMGQARRPNLEAGCGLGHFTVAAHALGLPR